jgi:hypothetical protein
MSVVTSKYTVLSNKPVPRFHDGVFHNSHISFTLPFWFTNWQKQKVIKVYGCSFAYLDILPGDLPLYVPRPSIKYANQFISVHSNIVRDDTEHITGVLGNEGKPTESETEIFADYMMVANNYYTPKIYNLTNSAAKEIEIWFKDAYGNTIDLQVPFSVYNRPPDVDDDLGSYFATFKMEIELAIMEQK